MKILKVLGLVCSAGLMLMSGNASAREFGDIYKQCGLGAMIFPKPQDSTLAVITNVTFDLGTTAIISDASSPETCKGGRAKTAALILEAYPSLEKELAQGFGDHLDALLAVGSCPAASQSAMTGALRSGLAASVEQASYTEQSRVQKAENLYMIFTDAVAQNPGLSCTMG